MEKEEFLKVYRHSLSHILAKAVIEIFGKENVQYAIGPQIENGFYYDFVLPRTITNDDFKTIEAKMHEILKRKEVWTRKEVSRAEALEIFKTQKFKTELIQDLPENETISIYYTGDDYVDLCRGPHVENSQELLSTAFQIKSTSGSYWRGDEHRDQMQRIYVYAFPSKDELKQHLALVKEAMERDHKSLAISSTCSCSIQRLPECLIGFHVAGNFSMRCLISGEIFTRIMVIRKYLLLSSITRSFGRQAVTGHIIRIICS